MFSLVDPEACRALSAAGVRWRVSPVAASASLLRDAALLGALELGAYAVALHPADSVCDSDSCHLSAAGSPLVETDPLLGVCAPLTIEGGEIDALVTGRALGYAQSGFAFVRSECDPCLERAWLVLPGLERHELDAFTSRCRRPDERGSYTSPQHRGEPASRYLDALDNLACAQLAVLTDQPEALMEAASSEALFANPGERLPFDLGRWVLGHGVSLELPPPVLPLRVQARTSRWSSRWRSDISSVRAGMAETSVGREWAVRCDLDADCGHHACVVVVAHDAGCYETRWAQLDEDANFEEVAHHWVPLAGQQVEAGFTLWASRLRHVTEAAGRWDLGATTTTLVAKILDADVCATPVCGTRWWRIEVGVPVRCDEPGCHSLASPNEMYLSVLLPWDGRALLRGDVVEIEGVLTVSVVPSAPRRR